MMSPDVKQLYLQAGCNAVIFHDVAISGVILEVTISPLMRSLPSAINKDYFMTGLPESGIFSLFLIPYLRDCLGLSRCSSLLFP